MNKTDEVLDFINKIIREERGNRVTIDSKLQDANLDSFGVTMLFMNLDNKYNYFIKGKYGDNPFEEIDYKNITIKEIINTCLS